MKVQAQRSSQLLTCRIGNTSSDVHLFYAVEQMICMNMPYMAHADVRLLPGQTSGSADGFLRRLAFEIVIKPQMCQSINPVPGPLALRIKKNKAHQSQLTLPETFQIHNSDGARGTCQVITKATRTESRDRDCLQ